MIQPAPRPESPTTQKAPCGGFISLKARRRRVGGWRWRAGRLLQFGGSSPAKSNIAKPRLGAPFPGGQGWCGRSHGAAFPGIRTDVLVRMAALDLPALRSSLFRWGSSGDGRLEAPSQWRNFNVAGVLWQPQSKAVRGRRSPMPGSRPVWIELVERRSLRLDIRAAGQARPPVRATRSLRGGTPQPSCARRQRSCRAAVADERGVASGCGDVPRGTLARGGRAAHPPQHEFERDRQAANQ